MGERRPLVSVVLPTHNRAAVLRRAIDSVLVQSYDRLELIVVDDASRDGTEDVLASIYDPRLSVLRNASRLGAARSRNCGVQISQGPLVAFQDSDDEWLPEKLALQVDCMNVTPNVGWVGGSYFTDAGGQRRLVWSQALVAGRSYEKAILMGEPFITPTWLVHKRLLVNAGLFDTRFGLLEDWDLIFKLADTCRFIAVPEPVLLKHSSADSDFGDVRLRAAALALLLTEHAKHWRHHRGLHAGAYRELARLYGRAGEQRRAYRALGRAIALEPLSWRPYALGMVLPRPRAVLWASPRLVEPPWPS